MPERSSKPKPRAKAPGPPDINTVAARILGEATGELHKTDPTIKNEAAVSLGRLGGLRGGPARAKKLSAKRRTSIAKKAALARWNRLSPQQKQDTVSLAASARFKKRGA